MGEGLLWAARKQGASLKAYPSHENRKWKLFRQGKDPKAAALRMSPRKPREPRTELIPVSLLSLLNEILCLEVVHKMWLKLLMGKRGSWTDQSIPIPIPPSSFWYKSIKKLHINSLMVPYFLRHPDTLNHTGLWPFIYSSKFLDICVWASDFFPP